MVGTVKEQGTFIKIFIAKCSRPKMAYNINVKTVKTNITIVPFKDSTSVIIKYKDEVMIKNDHKLYILDSIKIVYIQKYGFAGILDTYIELNKCYN